jgi:hypothetical protein
MGVTGELCDKIAPLTYGDLRVPVIERARQLFLDGLAVAVAGTEEHAIRLLAEHYRGYGARPEATALGSVSAQPLRAPLR